MSRDMFWCRDSHRYFVSLRERGQKTGDRERKTNGCPGRWDTRGPRLLFFFEKKKPAPFFCLCLFFLFLFFAGGFRLRGRYTHRAHHVVHRARTAHAFLPTLSCIFHIFSGWQGRGGLRGKHTTTEASTPSSSPMVVVAAHTPCQGRAVGRGRRGCRTLRYGRSTEEPSAPQGGARHPWQLSAIATAITTWLGALSRSHGTRAHHKGGANSGEVQKTAQGERKGCTRTWKMNAPRAHRVVHRAHRACVSL